MLPNLPPSLPLFEFTERDIPYPRIFRSLDDFLHGLKQVEVFLGDKHQVECFLIERRKVLQDYFLRFAVWDDGNWSCLYDERSWAFNRIIPPELFKTAYRASNSPKPQHYFHLETHTAGDLIIKVVKDRR